MKVLYAWRTDGQFSAVASDPAHSANETFATIVGPADYRHGLSARSPLRRALDEIAAEGK